MKIAVIADAHANLPALEAALSAIQRETPDTIIHLGDAIAIGPYPAECVDLLESIPNLHCVRGNHELYYLNGLPNVQPSWMSDGEVKHQLWTHQQLGQSRKAVITEWPFLRMDKIGGREFVYLHYGLTRSQDDFLAVIRDPTSADLDQIFQQVSADWIFFGHDHARSDIRGRSRYINPGSLGCCQEPIARFVIAEVQESGCELRSCSASYDDSELYLTFERRAVPEREFIYKTFFGGRFPP